MIILGDMMSDILIGDMVRMIKPCYLGTGAGIGEYGRVIEVSKHRLRVDFSGYSRDANARFKCPTVDKKLVMRIQL